jgi:hypothetical protein
MVGFVDDQHVPSRGLDLFAPPAVAREEGRRGDRRLYEQEGVSSSPRFGFAAVAFVRDGERQVESPEHLDEPLIHQRLGNEDQDARGLAAPQESMDDESRFDCFPKANFVREKGARPRPGRDLPRDSELVGDELNPAAEKPTGFRSQNGVAVDEGATTNVEASSRVPEPGE